jgi:hypothetical protein
MKSVDFLKALGLAACLTIAGGAYAQTNPAPAGGDTGTMPAAPAAASPAHGHMHMHSHESKAQRTANRKLGYAVRRAIGRVQGVDVSRLIVRSRDGDITLLGSMPDQSQVDKAAEAAKGVAGVKSVTNDLSVHQQ